MRSGGSPCLKSCWLFENCEVLGVELRLTDKKRMGGSCDFLIKLPTGELVLGDLKSVASVKACKARKPATEQLGAYLHMLARCYPKIMCRQGLPRSLAHGPDCDACHLRRPS